METFPGVYKQTDINLTYFYTSGVDLIYKSIFPNTKRLIAPKMKPYNGTVILIVTADLYSSIETQIMLLQAYCEKLIIIGQETPGTNGDITTLGLPLNIHTQMTGTIFEYPDGRQFQQKGIVPDIIVDIPFEVEQKGSIAKREFMIDKAFNVAQEILNKSSLLQ